MRIKTINIPTSIKMVLLLISFFLLTGCGAATPIVVIIIPIASNPIFPILVLSFFAIIFHFTAEYPIFRYHLITASVLLVAMVLTAIFYTDYPALCGFLLSVSAVLFILVVSAATLYIISFLFDEFPFLGYWLTGGLISFDFLIFWLLISSSNIKDIGTFLGTFGILFVLWLVLGVFSAIFWFLLFLLFSRK